ncbi:MATE family efflux transporter [Desulfitobacterium sp.]|uniref:MATE family efflux transporter n=1 Tax=Desulfitobacterium sp. TaxID=49981 RepID=UPI002B206538|nr:MATE family efflux transporter [Desulfitobacterium sp.]MEA4900117.1 MATE family efflux transporter [Desulfitobacterium sp.]
MIKHLDLRDGNINKLLLEFSIPAIIGMLVMAFYVIIGRIFVGQGVGSIALAAVTVAQPIMTIMMAFGVLIGIGATALASIRMGEQKYKEVEEIAGNATLLLIILPLVIAVIYYLFSDTFLRLFGASEEVLPYARDYMNVFMLGAIPGALSPGLNNFIRAQGNPRFSMTTQIIGAVINIVFNYIFIFMMGLGIKGSALATVFGQVVSMIWVLSFFFQDKSRIKLRAKNLKPKLSITLKITTIGFAPFALQLAASVQQTILNQTVKFYGGDLALSAVGIIMSTGMLFIMPIIGLSQGAQPIVGFNYGAKLYNRVKEAEKKAIFYATIFSVVSFFLIRMFAIPIVGLFSAEDPALTELSAHALVTFFALLPIIGFQIMGSNYFQAVGKAVESTILSLSRQVLFFIPLLLILPRFWGIEGVWRTAPIADACSVLLTGAIFLSEMRKLSNMPKVPSQDVSYPES